MEYAIADFAHYFLSLCSGFLLIVWNISGSRQWQRSKSFCLQASTDVQAYKSAASIGKHTPHRTWKIWGGKPILSEPFLASGRRQEAPIVLKVNSYPSVYEDDSQGSKIIFDTFDNHDENKRVVRWT